VETLRFTLPGVGAMNSPRYAPAGLLAEHGAARVTIDGGPGAEPAGPVAAWLVTDEHAELIASLRRLAAARGLVPHVGSYAGVGLDVIPHPVVHTSHPTAGYLIAAAGRSVAWAPEFLEFPGWAAGSDLMFADAAGWARPIRFARGTGGSPAPGRDDLLAGRAVTKDPAQFLSEAEQHQRRGQISGISTRCGRSGLC
jgi:hypothetical protein